MFLRYLYIWLKTMVVCVEGGSHLDMFANRRQATLGRN